MRALEFITGYVIYNPAYTYKFQLKTTRDGWVRERKIGDLQIIRSMYTLHSFAFLSVANWESFVDQSKNIQKL